MQWLRRSTTATWRTWLSTDGEAAAGWWCGWTGCPVSMAQVGLRRMVQSRRRSSTAWAGSSATVQMWVDCAGSAHGHIGQLSAAAVGEEMGPADRGALRAVNRCRVPVPEPLGAGLLAGQTDEPAVVGAQHQTPPAGVDGFDGGPLGGDQAAVRAGGQGDDPVAGPVGQAAGADHFGARQPPGGRPSIPGPAG